MKSISAALLVLCFGFNYMAIGDNALVLHGDSWHYRKGTNAPQANWKTAADASLDASWLTGNGGFGYADNVPETVDCQTLLSDMLNTYSTIYIRRQFEISSVVDTNLHLMLAMDYDDGFIAWLDGVYLTSANVTGAPAEPGPNATAPASHEASHGNNSPQPAIIIDLGGVSNRLAVGTHTLAIMGLNNALNSSDLIQVPDFSLAMPPQPITNTWHASDSPIVVPTNVTVLAGQTLVIEPGTTVQFGAGVNLDVADGGLLLAEGMSNAPILFTHSGAAGNWGHVTISGSVASPETRITYARFEFNLNDVNTPCIEVSAGTAYLDNLIFANPASPYIYVDGASFVISRCYFPNPTTAFEPCHGTAGIKSGGHGLFLRNFFGKPHDYRDVVDFTGGNRPGQPIVQFIENVVTGGDDDGFDLDGTDAWVDGNIFLHFHKNPGTPDSSGAITGGNTGSDTSQITILRNIMFDCDQGATAKQGNFFTFYNNTFVHQTHIGGNDSTGAVVTLADAGTTQGVGAYLEGNIIYDIEQLTRNVTSAIVTFSNNVMPVAWSGPGGGNTIANPMFKHIPSLAETHFTNWADAQVMWDWLSLLPGSPGLGTGPNGRDQGAVVPAGASVSGEPHGTTTQHHAELTVGINRTGHGIPVGGWPNGSGYTHYKWRLDTNETWSAETPVTTLISLTGLADGPHQVEVIGKNDAGFYQDDPTFGPTASITSSDVWMVQTTPRITSMGWVGSDFVFHFTALAGDTYSVEYKNTLDDLLWQKLQDVPAQPTTGDFPVTDSTAAGTTRFYRLVAPAQ